MNTCVDDSINTVLNNNLNAAKVLSRHGIDYCSEGGKSLKEACAEAGITCRKLMREIRENEFYRAATAPDISIIGIDELTRYIERYHHHYTIENIAFIKTNMERLLRLHGRQFPELEKINRVFDDMTAHLTVHMNHEEFIIFPYIRKMVKHGRKVKSSIFRSVKSPIAVMVTDHETENECLKQLDYLTHHYTAPLEADNTFKVTYHALRDLEKDIHAHLEIENDVLFPKALEMEKRFNNLKYTHQTSADHILDVEQPKNQPATNVFESL